MTSLVKKKLKRGIFALNHFLNKINKWISFKNFYFGLWNKIFSKYYIVLSNQLSLGISLLFIYFSSSISLTYGLFSLLNIHYLKWFYLFFSLKIFYLKLHQYNQNENSKEMKNYFMKKRENASSFWSRVLPLVSFNYLTHLFKAKRKQKLQKWLKYIVIYICFFFKF